MLHGTVIADFFQHRVRSAPLLEEAETAYVAVGDEWSLAMAALLRGALWLVKGDFDRGPDGLRDAAQRFEALGNPWGRSYGLRHLADVLAPRGRYDEAAAALHDAVVGLRAVGGIGVTSSLAARLGYIYAVQGRADDAERWLNEALDAAERQRYVPNLALDSQPARRRVASRAPPRRGRALPPRCAALYADRGVHGGLALALASLGYIEELRGNAAGAEALHRDALDAACRAGDLRTQALALEGVAGAASLRGDDRTRAASCSAPPPRFATRPAAHRRRRKPRTSSAQFARVRDHGRVARGDGGGRAPIPTRSSAAPRPPSPSAG